jgi:murein DD-endopeptidase MepM/ murein hydrolase activator NlpD
VTYDVRPGDTVGVIAGRFGLEPNTILSANDIDEPTLIYAGQNLIIPPPHSMVAKVRPGDSLNSLAARWGVDPETIATYPGNDIADPDSVVAGQSLVIPREQASDTSTGASPDATGTATANGTTQPGASQSPSTSSGGSTNAPKPTESVAPTTPSIEPEPASPGTSHPPVEPGPAQEPGPTPSPEAGSPIPAQPSPASDGNAPDSELSPTAHPRGNFIWPAKGTVTQRFGPTNVATDPPHAGYEHFHTGLDIANARGTPVVAADDGIVAFAGWATDGLGYTVKIDHADGFVTWYGHLAEQPSVKPGDQVGKGETLGSTGSTGNSAGPHVHFKIVHHGTYLNPVEHLP